jgi:hypothetical protein
VRGRRGVVSLDPGTTNVRTSTVAGMRVPVAYERGYGGPGGALLLVEDEGAARRGLIGSRVPAGSLSLMSGELNRAG